MTMAPAYGVQSPTELRGHPYDELSAGGSIPGQFSDELVELGEAKGQRLGDVDGTGHCDWDLIGSRMRGEK
jgi:hypothetical protein